LTNSIVSGNGYVHKGIAQVEVARIKNRLVLNPQDNYRRFK
jgi:hypothetical protein